MDRTTHNLNPFDLEAPLTGPYCTQLGLNPPELCNQELAEATNRPPPPLSSDGSIDRHLAEVQGQHRAERFEDEQEMLSLQVSLKQTEERAVSVQLD